MTLEKARLSSNDELVMQRAKKIGDGIYSELQCGSEWPFIVMSYEIVGTPILTTS